MSTREIETKGMEAQESGPELKPQSEPVVPESLIFSKVAPFPLKAQGTGTVDRMRVQLRSMPPAQRTVFQKRIQQQYGNDFLKAVMDPSVSTIQKKGDDPKNKVEPAVQQSGAGLFPKVAVDKSDSALEKKAGAIERKLTGKGKVEKKSSKKRDIGAVARSGLTGQAIEARAITGDKIAPKAEQAVGPDTPAQKLAPQKENNQGVKSVQSKVLKEREYVNWTEYPDSNSALIIYKCKVLQLKQIEEYALKILKSIDETKMMAVVEKFLGKVISGLGMDEEYKYIVDEVTNQLIWMRDKIVERIEKQDLPYYIANQVSTESDTAKAESTHKLTAHDMAVKKAYLEWFQKKFPSVIVDTKVESPAYEDITFYPSFFDPNCSLMKQAKTFIHEYVHHITVSVVSSESLMYLHPGDHFIDEGMAQEMGKDYYPEKELDKLGSSSAANIDPDFMYNSIKKWAPKGFSGIEEISDWISLHADTVAYLLTIAGC